MRVSGKQRLWSGLGEKGRVHRGRGRARCRSEGLKEIKIKTSPRLGASLLDVCKQSGRTDNKPTARMQARAGGRSCVVDGCLRLKLRPTCLGLALDLQPTSPHSPHFSLSLDLDSDSSEAT